MSSRHSSSASEACGNSAFLHRYSGRETCGDSSENSSKKPRSLSSISKTATKTSISTGNFSSSSIPESGTSRSAAHTRAFLVAKRSGPSKRRSVCFLITAAALIIAACLLVAALLLFFTVGPSPTPLPSIPGPAALRRQPPLEPQPLLLSPAFVLTALKAGKPELCLLDALSAADPSLFLAERIPYARHFDLRKGTGNGAPEQRFRLLHPLAFQAYARGLGISTRCHVVVYARDESPAAEAAAAFVWWLFKLYAHPRVSLMAGGLQGWKEAGYEVASGPVEPIPRGDFRAHWSSRWLATRKDVAKGDAAIIDARSEAAFVGKSRHILAAARGSIDGSRNLPARLLPFSLNRTRPQLLGLLAEHEIDASRSLIVYANSGLGGAGVVVALAEAGLPVRLYNGGWIQWSRHI